jgi:hypothetical protein
MSPFRHNLVLSGLAGLLVCGLLAAVCAWLVTNHLVVPPLPFPLVVLLTATIFGVFSLAEIPLMLFAMRRLAAERPDNQSVVMGLNAFYVFFAAVYGLPVLLLTGSVVWGLALCALGLVRFVASLSFVHEPLP